MLPGINEYRRTPDKEKEKNSILPNIRTYIAAILLFVPSLQLKSEGSQKTQQEVFSLVGQEIDGAETKIEYINSCERMFKDGIRKTLKNLNNINQIPVGGKYIDYYREEGNLTWTKLMRESIQILDFPEKIDISPKNITKPISSMFFQLGNRRFEIILDLGKIKSIYLTSGKLVIETTLLFDVSYDKQAKLPDLMFKLWKTPVGKGEKKWFRGTTVIEI